MFGKRKKKKKNAIFSFFDFPEISVRTDTLMFRTYQKYVEATLVPNYQKNTSATPAGMHVLILKLLSTLLQRQTWTCVRSSAMLRVCNINSRAGKKRTLASGILIYSWLPNRSKTPNKRNNWVYSVPCNGDFPMN